MYRGGMLYNKASYRTTTYKEKLTCVYHFHE